MAVATLCEEADKGADERIDKDLGVGTEIVYAMMTEDKIVANTGPT